MKPLVEIDLKKGILNATKIELGNGKYNQILDYWKLYFSAWYAMRNGEMEHGEGFSLIENEVVMEKGWEDKVRWNP